MPEGIGRMYAGNGGACAGDRKIVTVPETFLRRLRGGEGRLHERGVTSEMHMKRT